MGSTGTVRIPNPFTVWVQKRLNYVFLLMLLTKNKTIQHTGSIGNTHRLSNQRLRLIGSTEIDKEPVDPLVSSSTEINDTSLDNSCRLRGRDHKGLIE